MWERIKQRLRYMKVLETGMSFITLSWGLVLLWPGDTFAVSAYPDVHETRLALICLVLGLAQLIGMIGDVKFLRRAGHLLASGLWLRIGSVIFMTFPLSPSWPIYYIISLLTAYLYWKVGE